MLNSIKLFFLELVAGELDDILKLFQKLDRKLDNYLAAEARKRDRIADQQQFLRSQLTILDRQFEGSLSEEARARRTKERIRAITA